MGERKGTRGFTLLEFNFSLPGFSGNPTPLLTSVYKRSRTHGGVGVAVRWEECR